MTFLQFIKSRYFYRNLLLSLVVLFVFIWIVFKLLDTYTLHGKTVSVPDFSDVSIAQLDGFIEGKNIRYTIIDSIYDDKKPGGIVIEQDPAPGVLVKEDRKIYLYVTATVPPKINMPKLKDRSLRQAAAMIEAYGLKLNPVVKYVPDQCASCVLKQLYKGKEIQPGELIEKNAVIDLVVGKGLGDEEVGIPNLIGLTYQQAAEKLTAASLNEGTVMYDNLKDSSKSKVYWQAPAPARDRYVNIGGSVDFRLTADDSKIKISNDTTGGSDISNND